MAHLLKVLAVLLAGLVFAAPASAGTINVSASISGAGSITSGSGGCARSGVTNGTLTPCGTIVGNTILVLNATPTGNGTFTRWDGTGCAGQGSQCVMVDGSAGSSSFAPRAVFTDSTGPTLGAPVATLSTVTDRTVTVSWTTDETLTAAECVIDGTARPCSGLGSHTATLAEGAHTFRVRGFDINGTPGALTTAISFRILDTALVSTPAASSNDKNPTFVFSSVTGLSFDCRLDLPAFAGCGNKNPGDNRGSITLSNLADGTHTFRVRARDNTELDAVPAIYTWTVDTVAPTATLGAAGPGEGALQAVNRETFVFSSSEVGTFECQLDSAGFAPCASGITLENLSAAPHRFEVRAVDAAGNVGAAVARNWVVFAFPAAAPTPPVVVNPAPKTEQVLVTLAFFVKAGKRTTKFSSLQVKNVPLDATVKVTCAGKGCPSGLKGKGFTKTKAFGTVTLAKFIKKPLRAGDKITVTVSKPNAIAAVKVLTVRAGKKPLIATRCVPPGTAKPVTC
ncbi:hypothetical protein OJ997_14310 [Solirubrobacter phytolaccae]|uniref:Bacterial repeat domain-containing protein n=1 Tax=Solirubrobacter phytolaccae TaxID=1404360 RepID=A0A9X3S7V7_9ACTN|nr:hypothetical protein [Solirubrobacter phytolaccae]MDA0181474.1 hypothetical protein [Solirubrobacter phytolaccae]